MDEALERAFLDKFEDWVLSNNYNALDNECRYECSNAFNIDTIKMVGKRIFIYGE